MRIKGRLRRHKRITKNMKGSASCPRLVVFRSKKHMRAQLVDDSADKVLVGQSTLCKDFKSKNIKPSDVQASKEVGKLIAEKAVKLGIKEVCFDRAGYKYHGRVKALADGAREGGLKF